MATENSSVRTANYVMRQWLDERDKLYALFYAIKNDLKNYQEDDCGFEVSMNLAQIGIDSTGCIREIQAIEKMFGLDATA